MSAPDFTVDIAQNEYLPAGAREVHAIVTVTSTGSIAGHPHARASAADIAMQVWTPRQATIRFVKQVAPAVADPTARRDGAQSPRFSSPGALYTVQTELARTVQDGLEARRRGDDATAQASLGRAVALAHESGNADTAELLARLVDVIYPATGVVRLKEKVAEADEMALDTRSSKTVRVKK